MYQQVYAELCHYARQTAKDAPRLLAVSKTMPVSRLHLAYAAGAREFGENYVQEAMVKIPQLPVDCVWHMIGPLQSNKTRMVASHFDWVQSLDRAKIAQRLSAQRDPQKKPLQICIEVNIDAEANKSGCTPSQALELAQQVHTLPNLTLRGLMVIPAVSNQVDATRASFMCAARLFARLKSTLPQAPIDTLSMGMSGDWRLAVDCGSNMVRIGTAIFGPRS